MLKIQTGKRSIFTWLISQRGARLASRKGLRRLAINAVSVVFYLQVASCSIHDEHQYSEVVLDSIGGQLSAHPDEVKSYLLQLLQKNELHAESEIKAKLMLARALNYQREFTESITLLNEILDYRNNLSEETKAECNTVLGNIFLELGENTLAIERYEKVLEYTGLDKVKQSNLLANYAIALFNVGKEEEALEYEVKSLATLPSSAHHSLRGERMLNIGISLMNKGHFDSAHHYLDSAQMMLDDQADQCYIHLNKGFLYENLGEYDRALMHYHVAKSFSRLSGNVDLLASAYRNSAYVYVNVGDTQSAFKQFDTLNMIIDTLGSRVSTEELVALQAKYDNLVQENELINLQLEYENETQRRTLLLFILGIVFLAGGLGIFLTRREHISKLARQEMLHRYDNLKTTISAIEQERVRTARELHDGLGIMLSISKLGLSRLTVSSPKQKKLKEESIMALDQAMQSAREIAFDLMPGVLEKLGLIAACRELSRKITQSGKIHMSFEVQGENVVIDKDVQIWIYRIIQELTNNSIKHSGGSRINLLLKQENSFEILFSDNGKGVDVQQVNTTKSAGFRNILSRVEALKGSFEISPSTEGFSCAIYIPIDGKSKQDKSPDSR